MLLVHNVDSVDDTATYDSTRFYGARRRVSVDEAIAAGCLGSATAVGHGSATDVPVTLLLATVCAADRCRRRRPPFAAKTLGRLPLAAVHLGHVLHNGCRWRHH